MVLGVVVFLAELADGLKPIVGRVVAVLEASFAVG